MLLLLAAACGGCGQTPRETAIVFPVEGRFTVNGKPASGALVSFIPLTAPDEGRRAIPSQARADDSGAFKLTTFHTADGAPEGDYKVTLYWPGPSPAAAPHVDGEDAPLGPDQLRGRFASAEKSNLRAHVPAKPTIFAVVDLASANVSSAAEFHLPTATGQTD
jgi:hypothetical protein